MVPDIEIQHLSVCFDTAQGPVYAVNDLSTTFRAGRISGVIGESGSGKSVMGMSLLRLLPNTARVTGKCFFGEDELYSMPLRRLRRLRGAAIGLIPQNPGASLDPVMKLRRQLTEAITTHGRWKRREAEAQAAELLRRFGFEEPERILNQYSFQMSGGMNQRLVSALGLACRPGWVIADEPTTAACSSSPTIWPWPAGCATTSGCSTWAGSSSRARRRRSWSGPATPIPPA